MKILLTFGILILVFISCTDEKPKITYPENGTDKIEEIKRDSTVIEITDLPIHIDSTQYLIHPIGEFNLYDSRKSGYFSSSNYGSSSLIISTYSNYRISGNLYNLKFENIKTNKIRSLTDKNLIIKSVTFLKDIFDNIEKQILVYRILDKDTNRDKKLDDNDISALYISNIDGTNFTKMTSEFKGLIDWKTIPIMNRLYFRSIEDTNKNGEFDKDDKIYYNFVDLTNKNWNVKKYEPI